MAKMRKRLKRSLCFLMSALMCSSVFAVAASVPAAAVSYSEMSALDQYAYSGNDLGATYSKNSTTFKVWAPTASRVQLKRYYTGSDSEAGAGVIEIKDMTSGNQGVWSATVSGDIAGTYYTYLVTVSGTTRETVDIYARSTGVNGKRGMVLDLDSTDPSGWENDKRVKCENQTDSVIWEAHVRDFSISSDSGMTNKGKYLAFTEAGTTVNNDGVHPTGIDYLADLGVTHVHLLPVYDYASVDETKLSTDQFNWGYDPMNYNTPEGSYSTDPYNGSVRVNEFKRMVQSLHNKGIGVVMDVVYNHTYSGGSGYNDWFDYTVPGYYYRQDKDGNYSNASGCGNETASDRAMYKKFMIDSLTYWATEYHLDGFRFDLMGIHDTDTMNDIRAALDRIDPDILIYGEPWTADATPCPKPTAVQGNMGLVSSEIAAFNDRVRDAIKGSCFNAADWGFIQGGGFEEDLKTGIQANTSVASYNKWSKQPSQTVTYTSAHDNFTLYDKLVYSVKGENADYDTRYEDLVAMNKLAAGIILTSQGMSFFQAGEEFARTKHGDHNSYSSPTSVNQLRWNDSVRYSDLVSYYKGLIEIRKAYEPFRDPTNDSNSTIYFAWENIPDKVVAYTMYNKNYTGKEWNFAAVLHNANSYATNVNIRTFDTKTLPTQWVKVADGTRAGTESLGTVTGSTVSVPARSTVILIDKTSFDNTDLTKKCTVKVDHVINSTGKLYKSETLTGEEGESYSTSPLSSLISDGYKVTSTSGNTTGTFSEAGAQVTYYYDLDTTKYGSVTVRYLDTDGASIADDEIYTGLIGSSYSFTAKSIRGYLTPDEVKTGTYTAAPQTVSFEYAVDESSGLKVHYYNSNSWSKVGMYVYTKSGNTATEYTGNWPGTLMTADGSGWYSGDIPDVNSALFIANNFVTTYGEQDPTGYNTSGYSVSGEVWIKNGVVYPTGKVVVTYKTTSGTVLSKETLKGMADGTNAYSTSAKSFSGYTLKTTPSNASGVYTSATINVDYIYESKLTELVNTSYVDSSSVIQGYNIYINGSGSGGKTPYQYSYMYKHSADTDWTNIVDGYTTTATVSFKAAKAGSYTVRVTVKDSANQTASKDMTVTVTANQTLNNTSTVSTQTIVKNSPVTINGSATGGTAPYTYTYCYKRSANANWLTIGSANTTSTSASFTPSAAVAFDVKVTVTDSAGTSKDVSFKLEPAAAALTNNSTISKSTVAVNEAVTINGIAAGGTTPYTYAYFYKKTSRSSWIKLTDGYVSSNTCKLTLAAADTYDILVRVMDNTSTVAQKQLSLTVTANQELVNNSTVPATAQAGLKIALRGSASGGTAPYTYAYFYKSVTRNKWIRVTNGFVTDTAVSIRPSAEGEYDARIDVKDASGTSVKKEFKFTVTAASLINNSRMSTQSIARGGTVKLYGAASGGKAPYEYAYFYRKAGRSSWNQISSGFVSDTTSRLTISTAGSYEVRISVRDQSGVIISSEFELTVT